MELEHTPIQSWVQYEVGPGYGTGFDVSGSGRGFRLLCPAGLLGYSSIF
jgi:hypothetical protein